jgi:uncharacterized Zn-finger protein/predicted acylesterase/phospholipase RssA
LILQSFPANLSCFGVHKQVFWNLRDQKMIDSNVPHFHNEPGVPILEIGARKFTCIGAMPPFDHPHVFINMGDDDEIVCPYCSTLYRFNPALRSDEVRLPAYVSAVDGPLPEVAPSVPAQQTSDSTSSLSALLFLVLENLVRCWYIIVVALLSAMILAWTPQGREAFIASGEFSGLEDPNDMFALLLTPIALSFNVYLLTVFVCFTLKPKGPVAGRHARYLGYHIPAVIGLTALLAPSLLLQRETQLPTVIRIIIILVPPLAILLARAPTLYSQVIQAFLARGGAAKMEPNVLHRVRSSTMVFVTLTVVAALASFLIDNFLIAALILWTAFLAVDCFLFLDYGGTQVKMAALVAVFTIALWVVILAGVGVPQGFILAKSVISLESQFPINREFIAWQSRFIDGIVLFFQAPSFWIGSTATLLVAFDFWIALGFLVAWGYSNCSQFWRPIVSLFIASLCFGLFFTGTFNVREVRVLPGGGGNAGPASDVREHARKWLNERQDAIKAADQYPVFIVNSDGGGVRAAYWTASLLSALQDRDSRFADHVFAISGVSGGSLGAAVFAAMVKENHESQETPCSKGVSWRGPEHSMTWQKCAFDVLHHDFLASALARMLVADVISNLLRWEVLSDRAGALEEAFEVAWNRANSSGAFSSSFQDLWQGNDLALHVPGLFLNSTDARTGGRLVLSNVRLGANSAERSDLGTILDASRIRLSTAVLLSARFPVISPAGRLPVSAPDALVVDGGYVDNSGTLTAREVVDALEAALDDDKAAFGHVKIVTLMIANDPDPQTQPVHKNTTSWDISASIVGALSSPVETLDLLRQAHTVNFKRDYAKHVRELGGIVLNDLRPHADSVQFPLGWTLARRTMEAMDFQIKDMTKLPSSHFCQVLALLPHYCRSCEAQPR